MAMLMTMMIRLNVNILLKCEKDVDGDDRDSDGHVGDDDDDQADCHVNILSWDGRNIDGGHFVIWWLLVMVMMVKPLAVNFLLE